MAAEVRFSARISKNVRILCKNQCSLCRQSTKLPLGRTDGRAIGILSATPGHPRYEPDEEAAKFELREENALWVCTSCADLLGRSPPMYNTETLLNKKTKSEAYVERDNSIVDANLSALALYNIHTLHVKVLAHWADPQHQWKPSDFIALFVLDQSPFYDDNVHVAGLSLVSRILSLKIKSLCMPVLDSLANFLLSYTEQIHALSPGQYEALTQALFALGEAWRQRPEVLFMATSLYHSWLDSSRHYVSPEQWEKLVTCPRHFKPIDDIDLYTVRAGKGARALTDLLDASGGVSEDSSVLKLFETLLFQEVDKNPSPTARQAIAALPPHPLYGQPRLTVTAWD